MAAGFQDLVNGVGETTPLWLIRHGSTAYNKGDSAASPDRIRGWKDIPLSEKGRQQAADLGTELADSGIEQIEHSPLQRARDTAEEIQKTTGAKMSANPELKPWNVGMFTGMESDRAHPLLQEYMIDKPDTPVPDGESFNQFKMRALNGVADAVARANGKELAVVTHHRVERLVRAWHAAGQPVDLSIDHSIMSGPGDETGQASRIALNVNRIRGATHGERLSATSKSGGKRPFGIRRSQRGQSAPASEAESTSDEVAR